MPCPDDMELARWTDGHLPRERAEAVALHLQECLECRLAVGKPADELLSEALDEGGPLTFPPFEAIAGKLRAAYLGGSELDPYFLDPVLADELPILMAADTENRAGIASVPSYYCEDGRLVVTFRVDEEARVTAFFVSEDIERARFRVLLVGDQLFLGDADGRVVLSGMKAEDMLGCEISVRPVLATAALIYPDPASAGETILDLLPGSANAPPGRLRIRVIVEMDGPGLLLRLEGTAPEETLIVAIADDRTAQLLTFRQEAEARFPLGAPAPAVVRFHLVGRS